jgi:hypothetical protein
LSAAHTTAPMAKASNAITIRSIMVLLLALWDGYPLPWGRLKGAEANPAGLLRAEFYVSEHVSRNQDHAAFLIGEPQLRTVSQGCRHQLGHLVSALSGLEDNLTADVLNTDPDFHPVSPSYAAAWSGHAGRAHRPFL